MRIYLTTVWQISLRFRKDLCPIRSLLLSDSSGKNIKFVRYLLTSLITLGIVSYKIMVASIEISVTDPSTVFSTFDMHQLGKISRHHWKKCL